MRQSLTKATVGMVVLVVAFLLAIFTFLMLRNQGWLSPFGIASESRDSQIVRTIKRTQEVSLLSLGIQGIREENESRELFGKSIPGSGRTVFLQYEFTAKLGIDGSKVHIRQRGQDDYVISVPEFTFIGFQDPTVKVATEDGGVLSWVTPEIDTLELTNEVLNSGEQRTYITSNEDLLKEQVATFYDSLIASIDPSIETTYEFSS